MKKTQKKVSAKAQISVRKHFIILYALVGILTITTILGGVFAKHAWYRTNDTTTSELRGLIREAAENLSQHAVIDPKEKKQYVYQASLRFPLADYPRNNFRYTYYPSDPSVHQGEEVLLTTDNALLFGYQKVQGPELFDHVPQYQRCTRLFKIQFSLQYKPEAHGDDSYKQVGVKQLADGRTAYLYKQNGCAAPVDDLEPILMQVESY